MKVILTGNVLENNPQQKMSGVGRYALSLFTHLKKDEEIQAQLYSTKKESIFFSFLKKITGKDFKDIFSTIPLYYPFKKFPDTDIIHLTAQTFAIPLAWQKPKQPVIVTVHDIIPYAFNQYNSVWERFLYKGVIKGLRNATHLIADSEYTKKDLMQLLKIPEEKISVIYLGVDTDIFSLEDAKGKKNKQNVQRLANTILYVGSETKRKNLSTLLKAVAEVKKEIPNVKLIKVGLPENVIGRNQLKEQARKSGIAHNIVWKDYVEDVAEEYKNATVFILPSLYEGFGFPILEAMACGCPVICSDKSSLPEIAKDAALYFDGKDYKALAEKIILVLRDKSTQMALKKKGLINVKSFSWEKCVRETINVYEKVRNECYC